MSPSSMRLEPEQPQLSEKILTTDSCHRQENTIVVPLEKTP